MSTEEMNLQELESQFSEQEALRREKLVKLQEEGKDPFDVYKVERTHSSQQVKDNFEELEGKEVTVAGRIMSKRGQGKVVFSDIHDRDGKIQLFIKIDEVGEEALNISKGAEQNNKKTVLCHFKSNEDCFIYLKNILKSSDIILAKGSRGMHLEEIINKLIKKD